MDESQILKETLKSIDDYIDDQKLLIKKGEALQRLKNNPDFQLVIMDGYFDAEAEMLFSLLTNPISGKPIDRELILNQLDGIKHFKGYVGTKDHPGTLEQAASMAPDNIHRESLARMKITADHAEEE